MRSTWAQNGPLESDGWSHSPCLLQLGTILPTAMAINYVDFIWGLILKRYQNFCHSWKHENEAWQLCNAVCQRCERNGCWHQFNQTVVGRSLRIVWGHWMFSAVWILWFTNSDLTAPFFFYMHVPIAFLHFFFKFYRVIRMKVQILISRHKAIYKSSGLSINSLYTHMFRTIRGQH